jgi:hypothetical protein
MLELNLDGNSSRLYFEIFLLSVMTLMLSTMRRERKLGEERHSCLFDKGLDFKPQNGWFFQK